MSVVPVTTLGSAGGLDERTGWAVDHQTVLLKTQFWPSSSAALAAPGLAVSWNRCLRLCQPWLPMDVAPMLVNSAVFSGAPRRLYLFHRCRVFTHLPPGDIMTCMLGVVFKICKCLWEHTSALQAVQVTSPLPRQFWKVEWPMTSASCNC